MMDMTPAEFKEARQKLGLEPLAMCAALGYKPRKATISDFENKSVPEPVARLMRAYIDGYRPDDWPEV